MLEVVVRFAGTIVQVLHIAPGARCGVGRDAEIALDVADFAIAEPCEHVFGEVTITAANVARTQVRLTRRRVERRPFAYGAGSIAAHACLLAAAALWGMTEEDSVPGADTTKRRPTRIARFAVAEQTVKRTNDPPPVTTPITTDVTPALEPSLDEPSGASAKAGAGALRPHGRGAQIAPSTSPAAGEADANERRFDPSTSAAFDSVKVGKYTTVSMGSAGGERYELAGANGERKPLIVVSCDAASCLVIGGDAANAVRRGLEARLPEIVKCYAGHAATAGKKVEVDFGIDESGKALAVNVGGVGDYDACVANIVQSIQFAE